MLVKAGETVSNATVNAVLRSGVNNHCEPRTHFHQRSPPLTMAKAQRTLTLGNTWDPPPSFPHAEVSGRGWTSVRGTCWYQAPPERSGGGIETRRYDVAEPSVGETYSLS